MGLDLYIENRNKKVYGNDDWHELTYGRKTWIIADFFRNRNEPIDYDWLYNVTRESWDEFIATVHPYVTNSEFLAAFKRVEDYAWKDDAVKPSANDYNMLEKLLDALGDDTCAQLGPEWEVRTVIDWYNTNYEVQEAFNRGDEIRLVVSY